MILDNIKFEKGDDIIAVLKYRTSAEGGRKSPAGSGYRPGIQFDFLTTQLSGRQTFIDKEIVYPGDFVNAYIKFAAPHLVVYLLSEGM